MLAINFMAAQEGAVCKAGGTYEDMKIEGIASNTAAGITISVLSNSEGEDVLEKYIDGETLLPPNFIRVDETDKYFSAVTFVGSAMFILNK